MGDDKRDEERDDELSRRELLERAGAALGILAVAPACASEDEGAAAEGAATSPPGPGVDMPPGDDNTPVAGDDGGGDEPVAGPGEDSGDSGGAGRGGAGDGATGDEPTDDGTAGIGAAGENGMDASSGLTPVAFAKHADLDMAVARAVELAGGLGAIEAGQTVFIKPNAVSDRAVGTPGIRTSNEVLAAVIRLVKSRDPGHIIVGDRSARQFNTEQVFENTGMAEAALAAGADEVYRAPSASEAPDDWVLVQPPAWEETWSGAGGILAMRKILEADHLINVPTCKNHQFAVFSLSMKNFVGAIEDSSRDPLHYVSSIQSDFVPLGREVAILSQPFTPLMNIVDATTVLVNGGPGGDGADAVRASSGMILASTDRVAIDAAGVSLIQLEQSRVTVSSPDRVQSVIADSSPWALPQIDNAIQLGLGAEGPGQVELLFDGIEAADEAALRERFES